MKFFLYLTDSGLNFVPWLLFIVSLIIIVFLVIFICKKNKSEHGHIDYNKQIDELNEEFINAVKKNKKLADINEKNEIMISLLNKTIEEYRLELEKLNEINVNDLLERINKLSVEADKKSIALICLNNICKIIDRVEGSTSVEFIRNEVDNIEKEIKKAFNTIERM